MLSADRAVGINTRSDGISMKQLLLMFSVLLMPVFAFASSIEISENQFDNWPLTVDSGTLTCRANMVTFSSGGKTYALNGIARSHARRSGWSEIRPIWRDNPAIPGTKINIGPLISRGLELCR